MNNSKRFGVRGGHNKGASPRSSSDQKPCRLYIETGQCKYGARCKFSHDVASEAQGRLSSHRNHDKPSPRPVDSKLRDWKRLLDSVSNQGSRLPYATVTRFFDVGIQLMDGDLGAAQQAIKEMSNDDGLAFIKAVTDRHISEADDSKTKRDLWTTQVSPLFHLITHPRLLESNMLELEVAGIYSFLVGVNASRLIRVFDFVLDLASTWNDATTKSPLIAALEVSVSVLARAVDCSTTNIINDGLHNIVERFSELMDCQSQDENDFSLLQARKYLNYLHRRFGFGKTLPETRQAKEAPSSHETFTLRKDLPGHLSSDGPRHNNDHADISDILIMPTYEEIMSPRNEYLPVTDASQWHIPGIRGRLDREFRLLREDTVGQLRDAAQDMYQRIRGQDRKITHRPRNSARISAYDEAVVHSVNVDKHNGLELTVRCRQPEVVCKMGDHARRDWWSQSKRLQAGALTCVLDAQGMLQFFVIAESTLRVESIEKEAWRPQSDEQSKKKSKHETLSSDREWLYVNLNLVDKSPAFVGQALRWYRDIRSAPKRYLVEFPGVLLASFKHTLEALQQLSKKPDLPFADIIAPDKTVQHPNLVVSPPLFARRRGFEFDLTCLAKDNKSFTIKLAQPPIAADVSDRTALDPTQADSLINTLRREISLIQGPPGTGKSYTGEKLIQGLLANKVKASLGPIICVCFTNHALDQLLEHLLEAGIDGIIRIGSRSKSERLEELNLRVISRDMDLTKAEKHDLYDFGINQQDCQAEMTRLLNALSSCDSLSSIRHHLQGNHRHHYEELFGKEIDEDEFETVRQRIRNPVHQWLSSDSNIQRGQQVEPRDVPVLIKSRLEDLSHRERLRLHRHWLKEIRDPVISDIIRSHKAHEQAQKQRDLIRQEARHRCLQQANVVGVTTTGMARDLHLLRKLRAKVVVCEEAGEVLEAHILTALLPSVEQLILIGDHLQLHPQIQNYELQSTNPRGVQYSLDVSLFERLVQPPHMNDIRLPISILETQRRMHPSIAEMVRSTLYPSLKDGENVQKYPEIIGMQCRLFWMHHQHLEASAANNDPHNTSHSNEFEIEMATSLVSHLVRQGTYLPDDIAVLTPYLGQLQKLRRRMAAESTFAVDLGERDLEDLETFNDKSIEDQSSAKPPVARTTLLRSIRLATVDNFQGEEAKIVIISLVRSNPQNKCGFLSTSNRINVLMSRAKEGCYVLGNSETYRHVPMWNQIIQLLQDGGNYGTALGLQCPRHPNTPMNVSMPDHFAMFSPDGGCNVPCDRRLDCGHACYGPCHSDLLHNAVKCHEKCPRPKKGCDHSCPKECGEPCEARCNAILTGKKLQLPCGHVLESPKCWQSQDPDVVRCKNPIDRKIPKCGHTLKLPCHVDVNLLTFTCDAPCGATLPCGHMCRLQCHVCNIRENGEIVRTTHGDCKQPCGRKFTTCPHVCQQFCHGDVKCEPCNAPCEVRCSHSRCSKPCNKPCAPCAEDQCGSRCPHARCAMPCAAPCDWVPCSKRCQLRLRCGHQCPSMCGEICPDSKYCQQCGSEDVLSMTVDYLEMAEYKDIDLDSDPCIFPDCGHALTTTSMDGQMSMSEYYDMDAEGRPTNIKAASAPFSVDKVKVCPQCRGSLRNIARYGRIVRRAMLDESTKKFIAWSNARYVELAERLLQEQQALREKNGKPKNDRQLNSLVLPRLIGPIFQQLQTLGRSVGDGRYVGISKLYFEIARFRAEVRVDEQPFQKVANLVLYANRQKALNSSFAFDEKVIQLRGFLLATSLGLNCLLSMFNDFIHLCTERSFSTKGAPVVDFSAIKAQCQEVIDLSIQTDRPQHQAEGHLYLAQIYGLAVRLDVLTSSDNSEQVASASTGESSGAASSKTAPPDQTIREHNHKTGLTHIETVRALMANRSWSESSKSIMEADIEAIENMLSGGSFYRPVTADELRAVYAAMSREFSGTGHWYVCEMGHPFTVGECGMPMQQARCPECGSPVGGRNHEPAEGVSHAQEIEELGRGVGNLGI